MSLNERMEITRMAAIDYVDGQASAVGGDEAQAVYDSAYGLLYQLGEIDSARSVA